jgi:tartrate dehydratase alpha subunit/fumarate hydratase class I-like protein
MKLKAGLTLESVVDATALVVVRSSDQEVTVTCGGHEMAPKGEAGERVPAATSGGEGTQLGKRYTVEGVEVELLCVHAGEHPVAVNGAAVVQKSAKPLPASD